MTGTRGRPDGEPLLELSDDPDHVSELSLGYDDEETLPDSGELPTELRGDTGSEEPATPETDGAHADTADQPGPSQPNQNGRGSIKKISLKIRKDGKAVAKPAAAATPGQTPDRAWNEGERQQAHSTKSSASLSATARCQQYGLKTVIVRDGKGLTFHMVPAGNTAILLDKLEKLRTEHQELQDRYDNLRSRWHQVQEELEVQTGCSKSLEHEVTDLKQQNEQLADQVSQQRSAKDRVQDELAQEREQKDLAIGKKRRTPELPSEVDPKHCGRPQYFDGKVPNVRDWLMNLDLYFDLMADTIPVQRRVGTASTYLKGEALRFWHFRRQQLDKQALTDIEVFQRALIERFDSTNDPIAARYKLDKLQQGDNAMRVHIQTFDTLCSYVPDMAEGEKIHRFLTTVRPDCSRVLRTDPSTGARWVQYTELRKYALNQYAHEKVSPRAADAASTGQLENALDLLRAGPRKRGRTTGRIPYGVTRRTEGRNRSRDRSRDAEDNMKGDRGSGPSSGGAGGSGSTYTYHDKDGQKVSRATRVKNHCFEKGLCGICYGKGHLASQCTVDKLKSGFPPGMR